MIKEGGLSLAKSTSSAMKLRNFHATLPSILFPSIYLISLSVAPHVGGCAFFIVIGEIEIEVDSVPHRLPNLCPARIIGVVLTSVSSLLTTSPSIRRTIPSTIAALGLEGLWVRQSLSAALVTEPMSIRDFLQAHTIGMP